MLWELEEKTIVAILQIEQVGPRQGLTLVGCSALHSHLLTPPQQDGDENQKVKK